MIQHDEFLKECDDLEAKSIKRHDELVVQLKDIQTRISAQMTNLGYIRMKRNQRLEVLNK